MERVAIIGSKCEIGTSIANAFRGLGCPVVGTSSHAKTQLNHPITQYDACSRGDAAALRKRIGSVDVLIYVAGGSTVSRLVDTTADDLERTMSLNFTGAYDCCRAFIPDMIAHQFGRIIVIGSSAAHRGVSHLSAYSAAKHALLGMIRCIAVEYAAHKITANMVSPSYVDCTATHDRHNKITLDKLKQTNPQGHFVDVEQIADTCLHIYSTPSLNGQAIQLNGGAA